MRRSDVRGRGAWSAFLVAAVLSVAWTQGALASRTLLDTAGAGDASLAGRVGGQAPPAQGQHPHHQPQQQQKQQGAPPKVLQRPPPGGAPVPVALQGLSAAQRTAPAALARVRPPICSMLSVTTAFKRAVNRKNGRRILNGTVTLRNSGQIFIGFERVGVRLCSRKADGHLRETALCPDAGGGAPSPHGDVPPGGTVVCTWRALLPAAPAAGAEVADWTGVLSSVYTSSGVDRCRGPTLNPSTGRVEGGSCSAAGDK
ncbi:MAG: hypothetical protein J3K34DRAFT_411854 [Monoraphidium minutum]|nr:MAG: hypothetical protein J3K34DRAFT_411854 [Monoraphidium minutum]